MSDDDQDPTQQINSLLNSGGKWVVLGVLVLLAGVFAVKAVSG